MHRKISHTMRNFTWCAKFFGCLLWFCRVCAILHNVRNLSFTQSCSYSSSKFLHVMQNFCIAMRKYWLLDFFPWFFPCISIWLGNLLPSLAKGYEVLQSSDSSCLWASTCIFMDSQNSPSFLACFNDQIATKNTKTCQKLISNPC